MRERDRETLCPNCIRPNCKQGTSTVTNGNWRKKRKWIIKWCGKNTNSAPLSQCLAGDITSNINHKK